MPTDFAQRYREYDNGLVVALCQHCDQSIGPSDGRRGDGPREWHDTCWWKATGRWPPMRCFGCGAGIAMSYGAPGGATHGEGYCQQCSRRVCRSRQFA